MLKKEIRTRLLEQKVKKESQLIESKIVESRLSIIISSKESFDSLSEEKKAKVVFEFFSEMRVLQEQGLISEQFGEILGKLFGQAPSGITQAFVEPLVSSILGWFGLSGYFLQFVTSFIVSDPARLARATKDCKELTKLIAEALSEAMVIMIQQSQGLEGKGHSILRNTLGGAIKETSFVQSLEEKLSEGVCSLFDKYTGNAENVLDKIKGTGSDILGKGKELVGAK
jgi:hypothetical protein